eukprot:2225579-Pleurochrysis_carterae.AAC.8
MPPTRHAACAAAAVAEAPPPPSQPPPPLPAAAIYATNAACARTHTAVYARLTRQLRPASARVRDAALSLPSDARRAPPPPRAPNGTTTLSACAEAPCSAADAPTMQALRLTPPPLRP